MDAREAIHNRIHGPGYCDPPCGLCREVSDLTDAYAHELAEEIRGPWGVPMSSEAREAVLRAADLIDPEVETDG